MLIGQHTWQSVAEEGQQLHYYSQSMWKKAYETVDCYGVMYASKSKKQSDTDPPSAIPYAEPSTGKAACHSALQLTASTAV